MFWNKTNVGNQGFNLTNKHVTIEFTSGRKDNGLSAEVAIEDAAIPGYDTAEEAEKPVAKLTVVPAETKEAEVVEAKAEEVSDVEAASTSDSAEPVKTTSLFGN